MPTEILTRLTGLGIERDHAGIVGTHEDPASTGGPFRSLIVQPMRDAAAIVTIGGNLGVGDLRVKAPLLDARARIERDYLVERRAQDQRVLDKQWRSLELGACDRRLRPAFEI